MDEEKKTEEKPTADNIGEGDKPEVNKLIEDTNLAAKRLEDATKEARAERTLAEESYAKIRLGGKSDADPKTNEEITQEKVDEEVSAAVNSFKVG